MHVLGTAGHVDHGKSALVEALTGINPDRLREEQLRQMTIDLGFAWMTLPGGQEVGIIDVPGHRDFIENMLAGVGGIDAVILVVAADEGVMPQTVEHVGILDLLAVERAVVALTKTDLAQDSAWIDLVQEDVERLLIGTSLAGAPVVRVSARTGDGMPELVDQLEQLFEGLPDREDKGRPRLSIDRVFTIAGFGTVATGTLVDGSFSVGDEVEIAPAGARARIRGLQTHRNDVHKAIPGSRVAINLTGIDVEGLRRGDAVVLPGTYPASRLLDLHVRQMVDAPAPLKQNQSVKVFIGAAQQIGLARLLGGVEQLLPGQAGWLQIQLSAPIVAAKGDRVVLRRPSPPATLGGGLVADPQPARRHRAEDSAVVDALERALQGSPGDQLAQAIGRLGAPSLEVAAASAGLSLAQAIEATQGLQAEGMVRLWGEGTLDAKTRLINRADWSRWRQDLLDALQTFHSQQPMRTGMPQEALRSQLEMAADRFSYLVEDLAQAAEIVHEPPEIRLVGHAVKLTADQRRGAEEVLAAFGRSPGSPPSMKESVAMAGEAVIHHLLKQGELVIIADDVVLSRTTYDAWVAGIRGTLISGGTLTVAQVQGSLQHFAQVCARPVGASRQPGIDGTRR